MGPVSIFPDCVGRSRRRSNWLVIPRHGAISDKWLYEWAQLGTAAIRVIHLWRQTRQAPRRTLLVCHALVGQPPSRIQRKRMPASHGNPPCGGHPFFLES